MPYYILKANLCFESTLSPIFIKKYSGILVPKWVILFYFLMIFWVSSRGSVCSDSLMTLARVAGVARVARWEGGLLLIIKVTTLQIWRAPTPGQGQTMLNILTWQRIEAVAPILNIVINCQSWVPCYNLFLSSPWAPEPWSIRGNR